MSLFAAGLGEAVASTFGWDSTWAIRGVGLLTVLLLFVIVLAGVKFVIRLQLLLLLVLLMSALDFIIGSFAHTDKGEDTLVLCGRIRTRSHTSRGKRHTNCLN